MTNSYLDQEAAIRKVGRAYEILKELQSLLQLKSRKGLDEVVNTQELTEPLFREGLQALNHALGIMRSGASTVGVKSQHTVLESVVCSDTNHRTEKERGKKRRLEENSWTTDTTMPYDDGHQWRKYGDKKIIGTNLSRGYFRCTYKGQGCEAKKVVQQKSNSEPHLFKVTYINTHTCNFHRTISPLSPLQPSSFSLIEPDSDVNHMPDLQECKLSRPQLLNQGSCSSDAILADTSTNESVVERNCEWDWDSLLRDLVGFASEEFLQI